MSTADDPRQAVRDTHHRVKNDLQGIAALLRYTTPADPVATAALIDAATRIQAIALVHGLQMGADDQAVPLVDLLAGIAANTAQAMALAEPVFEPVGFASMPAIRASDAVAIALAVNEITAHALRTRVGADDIVGRWSISGETVVFTLVVPAPLPPGFSLDSLGRAMSGLGLVKSLLPRNGTRLDVMPQGLQTVLRLSVGAPVLLGTAS